MSSAHCYHHYSFLPCWHPAYLLLSFSFACGAIMWIMSGVAGQRAQAERTLKHLEPSVDDASSSDTSVPRGEQRVVRRRSRRIKPSNSIKLQKRVDRKQQTADRKKTQ